MTRPETRLLMALLEAHRRSCFRGNISSHAALVAFGGSADYCKAIAGALMSLGGVHAPLPATVLFLKGPGPTAEAMRLVGLGLRVPGWGNSFVKGQKDPLWLELDQSLANDFPRLAKQLDEVTATLHSLGKVIFPNPSAYTAAAAIALGIPAQFSPWLFVTGRLPGWSELLMKGGL